MEREQLLKVYFALLIPHRDPQPRESALTLPFLPKSGKILRVLQQHDAVVLCAVIQYLPA